jgi:hypothetical protein
LLLPSTGEDAGKLSECVSFILASGNFLYMLWKLSCLVRTILKELGFACLTFKIFCIQMLDHFLEGEDVEKKFMLKEN